MKLVLLFGNGAVGKMSVGQALMEQTGLRLFHNHVTIEPVIEVFGYYNGEAVGKLRDVFFREFVKTDLPGMIFTFMWAFDQQADWDYVARIADLFAQHGGQVYYVELVAPQHIRLQRNETANRLQHKASKRNLEQSRQWILEHDRLYRLESYEGELPFENSMRIDNSELEPDVVAAMIRERFDL